MTPSHGFPGAAMLAALARLWQRCRKRREHKHDWESIAVGPWQEAERTNLPCVNHAAGDAEPVYVGDNAQNAVGGCLGYEYSDADNLPYKWYRAELVCCRCGATHERYQVVTEKGMWVTE